MIDRRFSKFYDRYEDEDVASGISALQDLMHLSFKDEMDFIIGKRKIHRARLRGKDVRELSHICDIMRCLLSEVQRLEHEIEWRDEVIEQWKRLSSRAFGKSEGF